MTGRPLLGTGFVREILHRLRDLSKIRHIKGIRLTVAYDDGSADIVEFANGKVTFKETLPSDEDRDAIGEWTKADAGT